MKKSLLLLAALMAFSATAQKKVMRIHNTDGTTETRYVDNIARITFGEEDSEPGGPAEAVDLGLSVKWASWNFDADRPEGYGGYYAWGETEQKEVYDLSTYKFYNDEWSEMTKIGYEISGTPYDVVHKQWGDDWRMPTRDEWLELINSCEWTWTTVNGVPGYQVSGNNNSIFIPAAGHRYNSDNDYVNIDGFYWTGTLVDDQNNYVAYRANFGQSFIGCDGYDTPAIGFTIRPVKGLAAETDPEPEPGPMDMVDLGLSVKWASHNVGAADASEHGNYYSWGTTKVQTLYSEKTYPYYDPDTDSYLQLGDNISGTKYDVATVRWGNGWRMPTKEEFNELVSECDWQWTTQGTTIGYLVTGPNGNSIFLPASGFKGTEGLLNCGSKGLYASANPHERMEYQSYYLSIASGVRKTDSTYKCLGISVRPVHE